MPPAVDILTFAEKVRGLKLYPRQRVAMMAAHASQFPAPSEPDLELFRSMAGVRAWPRHDPREVVLILGVRSGKDVMASVEIDYELTEAHGLDLAQYMVPGQTLTVPVLGPTLRTTEILKDYAVKPLREAGLLDDIIEEGKGADTQERITLSSGVQLLRLPGKASAIRGLTARRVFIDEAASLQREGSNSDQEIYTAALTRQGGFPSPQIWIFGSPWTCDGLLYDKWRDFHGRGDDDVLVLQSPTWEMNLSPEVAEEVERARRLLRPELFRREYGAEFAESTFSFLDPADVEAAVVRGRTEMPRQKGVRYVAGADFAGRADSTGTRKLDASALSVGHADGDRFVQDIFRSWSARDLARMGGTGALVREVVRLLDRYGVTEVRADRYSADWVRDRVAEASGYRVRVAEPMRRDAAGRLSYADKSARYSLCYDVFAERRAELLDGTEVARQFRGLESQAKPDQPERIDHRHGQHDDAADATATCMLAALTRHYGERRAAADDSEDTRPVNPDDALSVYDEDIEELVAWAREQDGLLLPGTTEAWEDGALTQDQAARLRVDLVEARCRRDGQWALRWRLERGGIQER